MSTNTPIERTPDYDTAPWIKMPLAELLTPADGRIVYSDRWWNVTDDDCVLFFKSHSSPQCNAIKTVMERHKPHLRVVFIAVAYVPFNPSDYL